MMYLNVVDDSTIEITDDAERLITAFRTIGDGSESAVLLGGLSLDNSEIESVGSGAYVDNVGTWVKQATAFAGEPGSGGLCVAMMESSDGGAMNRFFTLLDGYEWDIYPEGPGIVWGDVAEAASTLGFHTANEIYEVFVFQGDPDKADMYDIYYESDYDRYVVDPKN